jgi:hypothetical protein
MARAARFFCASMRCFGVAWIVPTCLARCAFIEKVREHFGHLKEVFTIVFLLNGRWLQTHDNRGNLTV